MKFTLTINNQPKTVDVAPDTPLLWVLRDTLNLLGTKFGCGIGVCGACAVHLNGSSTRSCVTPVNTVGDQVVTTIEGLDPAHAHPLQQAWVDLDVSQCGYCQSGQIMTAAELLAKNPNPTDQDIADAMDANLCRCGAYLRIREGIHEAARRKAAATTATTK